jgi:uncharacterized glyoxalase superfamily protein PhnB
MTSTHDTTSTSDATSISDATSTSGTTSTTDGQASGTAAAVPSPQVWPTLRARDARGLIRFLVEAFGFVEVAVYGEGDHVDHAQLAWPEGGGIMLGSAEDRGPDDHWGVRPGTCGCYVVTDHPDDVHGRAVAAGATIIRELNETDYGSREFGARDPEGNLWSFGTYRGEPQPG